MSYVGQRPLVGAYRKLDSIAASFNGSQTTFPLTSSGQAVFGGTVNAFIISLNGVLQEPGVSYTLSGTNIVFSVAPAAGDTFFGVALGDVLNVGTVSDGSITNAKIATGAITADKIDPNVKIGGATGGGNDRVFVENGRTVTSNYTLSTGNNAHSVGPIVINDGVSIVIPDGARWVIS